MSLHAFVAMDTDGLRRAPFDTLNSEGRAARPRRFRRDRYPNYATLARHEAEGLDYRIVERCLPRSPFAVIAPHAGGIERGTSSVASLLAGTEFSLYLFEGLKTGNNFESLHITSRRFDEPRCLAMVAQHEVIVTVHGCVGAGEFICLGGLHEMLKNKMAAYLRASGFDARTEGHNFPAVDPDNLCNRGRSGGGVQLELSAGFRRRRQYRALTDSLRECLFATPPVP
jgi:phage replication-related protein YjqB (UPF0714/DUF867 family)